MSIETTSAPRTTRRTEVHLANEAWESLYRAMMTVGRELRAEDVWGELLENEYGVLYALSTAPDGLRLIDLADDVLITQAGLSRLIGRMEERGLVERGDDPDDRRACRIRLTARGEGLQRRIGAAHAKHVAAQMSARLDHEDLIALRDLCRRFIPEGTTDNVTA